MIGFVYPFLLILAAGPIWLMFRMRLRRREYLGFTQGYLLTGRHSRPRKWKLPFWLGLLALLMLIIGLASPYYGKRAAWKENQTRTVSFIIDVSGSMGMDANGDYGSRTGETKRDLANAMVKNFLTERIAARKADKSLTRERAGVYFFGDEFFIRQVPTYDYEMIRRTAFRPLVNPGDEYIRKSGGTEPCVALKGMIDILLTESFNRLHLSGDARKREKSRIFHLFEALPREDYVPDISIPENYTAPANCVIMVTDEEFYGPNIPHLENIVSFFKSANVVRLLNVRFYILNICNENSATKVSLNGIGGRYYSTDGEALKKLLSKSIEQGFAQTTVGLSVRRIGLGYIFIILGLVFFLSAVIVRAIFGLQIP